MILLVARYKQINIPVIVIVAGCDTHTVAVTFETRFDGYVLKGSVAAIAVEKVGAEAATNHIEINEAVRVVVGSGNAGELKSARRPPINRHTRRALAPRETSPP